MAEETTLIIGAAGQVGSELVAKLREEQNASSVIASDVKTPPVEIKDSGPFYHLDVLDYETLASIIKENGVKKIYNLAALLSATAEEKPMFGWKLNMEGLLNTLNLAKETGVKRVFWPSSIAVFGPSTPKENTPQTTIMDPNTVYGISKLAGERWCEYYYEKFGVDTRSVRYPGLISYKTEPGGGTTDYAIDIFHQGLLHGKYTSYLTKDTYLPMLYMPDAIRGTVELMEAPSNQITIRSSYNLAGFSFSPSVLAEAVKQEIPDFEIDYDPDFRQQIANGWPAKIDDQYARRDWQWAPAYTIQDMVKDMVQNLKQTLQQTRI